MIIAAFIIVLTFGAFFAPKVVNAASADNAAAVSQTEDSNAAATTASARGCLRHRSPRRSR